MEKRKPAKSPCPLCSKLLAPQGYALHFQRKHPGEKLPDPPAPASAAQRTESTPPASSKPAAPPKSTGGGILGGPGGIFS